VPQSLPTAPPDLILPQRAALPSHITSHYTQHTGRTGSLLGGSSATNQGLTGGNRVSFSRQKELWGFLKLIPTHLPKHTFYKNIQKRLGFQMWQKPCKP